MMKELFSLYSISDLLASVNKEIAELVAERDAASIETRQAALEAYTSYEMRGGDGQPLPPTVALADQNKYVDVALGHAEREILDTGHNSIPLQQLFDLVSLDVASPHVDIRMQSVAAHLIATGERKYDRYNETVANENRRYEAALQAFRILSRPHDPSATTDIPEIQNGKRIQSQLEHLGQVDDAPAVLLTLDEYTALCAGIYEGFDVQQLESDQQAKRSRINECIRDMNGSGAISSAMPFEAIYDPKRMTEINALMRCDTTASWLFDNIRKANVPVLMCRYTVPDDQLIGRQYTFASYLTEYQMTNVQERGGGASNHYSKVIEYIRLYTNLVNNCDLVVAFSHEARHHWQDQMISKAELFSMNPVENIVWGLFKEADAHAINAKVAWGIRKNTQQVGLYSPEWKGFERDYVRLSPPDASMATKVRKATQGRFIDFLEGEFAEPCYLDALMENASARDRYFGIWCRSLADSQLLRSSFLTRLSEVGDADYLDQEGMQRIRQIILDKLPQAIAKCQPVSGARHEFG